MSNKTKNIDFVFVILDEYKDEDVKILNILINKLLKYDNLGKIYICTSNEIKVPINTCILHKLKSYQTGDSLLSILRNRNITNDFILCTKLYNYTNETLDYIMSNPNTLLLMHKENPNPNIKLDEFNRVKSVDFSSYDNFGYESLGIFRINKNMTLTLTIAYHVSFFDENTKTYITSKSRGFDILDLFNHTNWGLFTFDVFNINGVS